MKKTALAILILTAALFSIPKQSTANEIERYATGTCMGDDGTIKAICGKVDPEGPCYKQTKCNDEIIE